ncbi:MAG: hypothetical protein ACR2NT_14535 [Acidimicrobiia bacterium]
MRFSRIPSTLLALVVGLVSWTVPADTAQAAICSNGYISGLTALPDLGAGSYLGLQGGLYPGGSNSIPAGHAALGLGLASQVQPLDAAGNPDPAGQIALVSIGVSNTAQDFGAFVSLASGDSRVSPSVVLVNGGIGGEPIDFWLDPAAPTWAEVESRVGTAGATLAQVQVAWVMLPDRNPFPLSFPAEQWSYRDKLQIVLRNLKSQFPNVALAYLTSLYYTGYGVDHPDIEPIAFEEGFGVKWTIEDQINGVGNLNANPAAGPVVAPWLAWGPYVWANGLGPDEAPGGQAGRADGLEWLCADYEEDGIHPSTSGEAKNASMLLAHFTSAPMACPWFLAAGVVCGSGPIATGFVDIAFSPFAADITWLADQGITNGCKPAPNALFCPEGLVTRGAMAAFLSRALNLVNNGGGDLFTDDDDSIFENDIDKIATAGITTGCQPPPNALFCPEGLVTRGEMAAFLSRALNLMNDGGGDLFTDDDGSVFETDIDRIAAADITFGCAPPPNARFCPTEFVTRGQMAAFLHRAFG